MILTLRLIFYGRLPGLNEIIRAGRANRYAANKQKKDVQGALRAQWVYGNTKLPKFGNPVNVEVRFFEKDNRRDDDNVFAGLKFILDELQEIGVIVNDSPKWCHIRPERFTDRKAPRIEVTIEEREKDKK